MIDFNSLIFESIKSHGVVSVALAGLVEQIIVPIPSPLVPMAAGFFFVPKEFFNLFELFKNLFNKAALPFAIGSTIGSTMVYLIAFFGGKWLIEKFKKWLGIEWEDVEAIKKKYFKGRVIDELVIFLSRAIPVLPSVLFSAACGAIRIKPVNFYLFTFLGLLVRGMVLGWVGWQSGEALFAVSGSFDKWEKILSVILVLVAGVCLVFAYRSRKKWLANLRK